MFRLSCAGSAARVLSAKCCMWWQQQRQGKDGKWREGGREEEEERERERERETPFFKKLNENMPFPNGLWGMAPRKSNNETPSKGTWRRAAGQHVSR